MFILAFHAAVISRPHRRHAIARRTWKIGSISSRMQSFVDSVRVAITVAKDDQANWLGSLAPFLSALFLKVIASLNGWLGLVSADDAQGAEFFGFVVACQPGMIKRTQ